MHVQKQNTQGITKTKTCKSSAQANLYDLSPIVQLQSKYGNRSVQRMYEAGVLQAKLTVGQPGEKYEQEADRVAERVMSMPDPGISRQEDDEALQSKAVADTITPVIQRVVKEEEEGVRKQADEKDKEEMQRQSEEEESAQAKSAGGTSSTVSAAIESGINSQRGGGQPLSESSRAFFEPRFGADFSGIKVHTDSNAAHLSRSVNAKAFTVGQDVFFGAGQYAPESSHGKRLMAHELTHVVQQNGSGNVGLIQKTPADVGWGERVYDITPSVPDFIQSHIATDYNVVGNTNWRWIWSSRWILYDSSDKVVDKEDNFKHPDYKITAANIKKGVASDDSGNEWTIRFETMRTGKPLGGGSESNFPWDQSRFRVYLSPIANANVTAKPERGNQIVSSDTFTPVGTNSSFTIKLTGTSSRSDSGSTTVTNSIKVGSATERSAGFNFEGLTGGMKNTISFEGSQSIAKTRGQTVSKSQSIEKTFVEGGLTKGKTYSFTVYPKFIHLTGSASLLSQNMGIVRGGKKTAKGGVRIWTGYHLISKEQPASTTTLGGGAHKPRPVNPTPKPPKSGKMNFYHGSTWNIAKIIPGNVKPLGGGDFAAGFYTHWDADYKKAHRRTLTWAKRNTKQAKERWAGIVVFEVPKVEYTKLLAGNSKQFDLLDMRDPDYKRKQKEWLDFILAHGREKNPTYDPKRGRWTHERIDPPKKLGYDIIKGPLYTGRPGAPGQPPASSEFKPMREGKNILPHQVVWANKGIDLLNDTSKVDTDLEKHDAT